MFLATLCVRIFIWILRTYTQGQSNLLSQTSAMESPAELQDLDPGLAREQNLEGIIPVKMKRSTGFDASPYAGTQEGVSRHPSRVVDPRSPMTRLRSSTIVKGSFSHPLAPQKPCPDALVDFDGPDGPYRPLNRPDRKKVITVLLYGLPTTCSSWAT